MKGSIVSEEVRSAGNWVLMEIDEASYRPDVSRLITKLTSLSGTTLVTDWGISEELRTIRIDNVMLSKTDYETLKGMQEDNSYEFLFGYHITLWKVAIESVTGIYSGGKYITTINLHVVDKYTAYQTS